MDIFLLESGEVFVYRGAGGPTSDLVIRLSCVFDRDEVKG